MSALFYLKNFHYLCELSNFRLMTKAVNLTQNDTDLVDAVKRYDIKFFGGISENIYAEIHAWDGFYQETFSCIEKGEGCVIKKGEVADAFYFRVTIVIKRDTVLDEVVIKPFLTTNMDITKSQHLVGYTGNTGKLNTDLEQLRRDFDTYKMPTASSTEKGGVKIGSNITNADGTISITKQDIISALGYTPKENTVIDEEGNIIDTTSIEHRLADIEGT